MWKPVELETTPAEFQQRVNEYIAMRNGAKLLKVIACINEHNELYKCSAYTIWGNVFSVTSMWLDGGLEGSFYQDTMTIGEMREFIDHPEMSFWFKGIVV